MGYSFSNIQLKKNGAFSSQKADALAFLTTMGKGLSLTENRDEADLGLTVVWNDESPWIAVVSDFFDEDPPALLAAAKTLSRQMSTTALAIYCYDSDYLFLNLIDAPKNVDIWANCGTFPDGSVPRRSSFYAWRRYVNDVDAFSDAMREERAFAEECLYDVEPMLALPSSQSIFGVGEELKDYSTRQYFYVAESIDN